MPDPDTLPNQKISPSQDAHRRLLLLSADWQTRATVLVTLKELGYEVMALPRFKWGLKALLQGRVEPPLVLVDSKDDPDISPEQVRYLRELLPDIPIILLTTAFHRPAYEAVRDQVDAFLVRPVTVGMVVEAVQKLLPPSNPPQQEPSENPSPG